MAFKEERVEIYLTEPEESTSAACTLNDRPQYDGIAWTPQETKFLIEKFEHYVTQIGPSKLFRSKRKMWERISEDIEQDLSLKRTYQQCENRFKTLLRRKRSAIRKIHTPTDFDEINTIYDCTDPSIFDTAKRLSNITKKHKQRKTIKLEGSVAIDAPKNPESIAEVLLYIHKQKEEAKERRHKEKLELIKHLFEKNNLDY